MDILAIDIGTVSIKYLRWRGKKGKGTVLSTGDYPYKGGWDDLRRVLSEIRLVEPGDVALAVAVTSQEILKKTFTIPVLPKNELKEALAWSASKVVSTSLDEMVYENIMLGPVDERGIKKDEVLFVGATKGFVNRLLAVCEDAGFKKVKLITDIAVMYPALVEEEPKGSVAVIDIGGRQTGIYIIDGKKLRFVREILTACESFCDALISGFGFSYEEAEKYKQEKGFNDESEEVLALPFGRLGSEIQRTFNVYGQRYPERPIAKIYVTGRGAGMPNFVTHLEDYIGEKIELFAPPVPLDARFLPCYCMCTNAESVVNLLPADVKEKEKEEQYKKLVRIGSIVLASILLILSLNTWSSLTKATLALQVETTALSQKKQALAMGQNPAPLTAYAELVPVLKDIEKNDDTLLALLKFLSSRLPGDVYLREIEFYKHTRLRMPSDEPRQAAPKEESSVKSIDKAVLRDILRRTPQKESTEKKEGPEKKVPARDAARTAKEDGAGIVALSGYIVGDAEAQGVILLDLVIRLEKSGLMKDVDVVSKEPKEINGRKVMGFLIEARCGGYEV